MADKKKDEKKASGKKAGKKDKKKDEKKASVKKDEKKASGKKGNKKGEKKSGKKSGKKASDKKVAKEVRNRVALDAVTPLDFEFSGVGTISTASSSKSASHLVSQELSNRQTSTRNRKFSLLVVLAVIVVAILIAGFVVIRDHNNSTSQKPVTSSTVPSATPSPSLSMVVTPSISPSPTATSSVPTIAPSTPAASTTDLPPVRIVGYFNSTGATITWGADPNASGIKAYTIEESFNGGVFKLIATLPATRHSLDVIETDTNGWTSFRVSAVYSDGTVVAGKLLGLPSQYS